MVIEVRYKLRMLGLGLERISLMVGDNLSVILNTTIPSSLLKKKHNAVTYFKVKETVAFKVMYFYHLPSTVNVADVLTKFISSEILHGLLRQYLYRKLKIHGYTQKITAALIRKINYTAMSLPPPVDAQPCNSLAFILNSHNVCCL